jgi:hypothetical protein
MYAIDCMQEILMTLQLILTDPVQHDTAELAHNLEVATRTALFFSKW